MKFVKEIFASGLLRLKRKDLSVTPAGWQVNNLAGDGYSFLKVTGPTAAWDLTGISGGSEGRVVILYNATGYTMVIKHDNANSLPANRIYCFQNMSYAFPSDAAVVYKGIAVFIYDPAEAGGVGRWLLVTFNGT